MNQFHLIKHPELAMVRVKSPQNGGDLQPQRRNYKRTSVVATKWSLGSPGILWDPNGSNGIRAPCLSHIMREKPHHPHGTAAIQKVTSSSGKSHQGRRITMAQPVSSILRDLVKSSRSIAHSDDFERHNKLIHTNSRQLFLLDLKILYWCPASRDHKPLLVQPQISCNANWVSCSKSYWQGYDLAWYKDMEAPCFPQPNLWLARCASRSWAALRKFVVLSTQRLRVGITPFIPLRAESVAGLVGAPAAPSVVSCVCSVLRCLAPSCRLRRLAKWCEMVQMVSAAKQPRYTTAMFHSNQPETFPLSAGVSRPYLPQQASSRQAAAGKQQQASSSRQAAAASRQAAAGAAAAAAGKQQASSRGKQQRQAAEASSRGKQQRQAAEASSRGKQQRQAAEASSNSSSNSSSSSRSSKQQQAAGKQQQASSNQRLPPWKNEQI